MTNSSVAHLERSARPAYIKSDLLCIGLIVMVTLAVGAPGITQGGLGWSDAPNHVFDGIFVYEFLRQWPMEQPRAWAEQFYLQYPALGIIVYYPPGFAVVEAAAFALFGVNIVAARMTVLLFAVGACLLMYLLGRRWFDRATGLFAALLLVTCPHGLWWMNDIMLEWPATFWILAAVYCYQQDRDTRRLRWVLLLGVTIVMAFITKQTAGFILPVLGMHAMMQADRRRFLLRPALLVSIAIAGAIIGAYVLLTRSYTALPSHLLRPSLNLSGMLHWPAEILGWPLLPVALLGLFTLLRRPDRGPRGLLLIWFVAWTGFSLSIAAKEPRYLFFSIPPLAFAAARFMLWGVERSKTSRSAGADDAYRAMRWTSDARRIMLLSVLVAVQLVLARWHFPGHLPTHAGAVAELAKRPGGMERSKTSRSDADLVLVDAVRDGQFIFDVYQNAEARGRIIPLRASKFLYARAAREKYDYQQFVEAPEDIVALLNRYGVRYIVIESAYPKTDYLDADPPPRKMLRELLRSDERFARVESWPLECDDPAWDGIELQLFEYLACPPRMEKTIRLSIPAMGREVEFKLP